MCELILSDIWSFLCNLFNENDRKINSKTGSQVNRTGFRFHNRNRISCFRLTSLVLYDAVGRVASLR